MIEEKFRQEKGRAPTPEEIEDLEAQLETILDAYEEALGLRPPVGMVIDRLDVHTKKLRHSKSNGSDWAQYIPPRDLIQLGMQEGWIRSLYLKHLAREPDQAGKEWWLKEWERQFVEGIDADG